jgi:hypothetical protein
MKGTLGQMLYYFRRRGLSRCDLWLGTFHETLWMHRAGQMLDLSISLPNGFCQMLENGDEGKHS